MRVLKWIVDRVNGRAGDAAEGPFGFQPRYEDLHWKGLDFPKDKFRRITDIDRAEGLEEAEDQSVHFESFGMRLPPALETERQDLIRRLKAAPPLWSAESFLAWGVGRRLRREMPDGSELWSRSRLGQFVRNEIPPPASYWAVRRRLRMCTCVACRRSRWRNSFLQAEIAHDRKARRLFAAAGAYCG